MSAEASITYLDEYRDRFGGESVVDPVSFRVPPYIIDGLNTAERFNSLQDAVDSGKGMEFWGIRDPNPETGTASNRPDDLRFRWMTLVGLLRSVPELEEYYSDLLYRNYFDIEKAVERQKEAALDIKKVAGTSIPADLELTTVEAYNNPFIRYPAMKALQMEGDPVIEVVRRIEVWRVDNRPELDEARKELGRKSFEQFIHSFGAPRIFSALGAAAAGHYLEP